MLRALRLSALVLALAFCAHAHASPITYNIVLTPTGGSSTVVGSFTLNFAPSSTGVTTYKVSDVSSFQFTYGSTFDASGLYDIIFTDGTLSALDYTGTFGLSASPTKLKLRDLTYSFSAPVPVAGAQGGTITANVAATPEPSSLILAGTGFAGLVGMARRRRVAQRERKKAAEPAAA